MADEPIAGTDAPPAAAPVEGAPPADVVRPADLPESFWDEASKAPKYGDIAARLTKADELEAAEASRAEAVPADPTGYEFKIAGDPILGPDGTALEIDASAQLAQAVAGVAHKHGLPQEVISDFARAAAEAELAVEQQFREALSAETAKLGANASARIGAVQRFIASACGDEARGVLETLGTASAVRGWELIMAKMGVKPVAPSSVPKPPARSIADVWFPSMAAKSAAPTSPGRKADWFPSMQGKK